MRTTLVIFISAVVFLGEYHGFKIDTVTTSIKKDTEKNSQRYRRSSSTYVADENGQRVVILTSSSPGFNSGPALTDFGSNKFVPNGGTGFNKPLGSFGGSTLGGSGGTLGGGGAVIGDSFGLGNTGFRNNGNRNLGTSKYPSAQIIIEVLRLLGVPNLPLRPPPSFGGGGAGGSAGGAGGGFGGGDGSPGEGFNEALACSLLGRCVDDNDKQNVEPPKQK